MLDAILQAGLKTNSLPEKAYLVRPHPVGGHDQVLKIDWCGIRERGDTLTNYQLFPGDRIVVPGTKTSRPDRDPHGTMSDAGRDRGPAPFGLARSRFQCRGRAITGENRPAFAQAK